MADGNGMFSTKSRGGNSMRDGDLQEEDVWAVVVGRSEDSSPKVGKLNSSGPRKIPRANYSHEAKVVQQSSAPVNIPDWSKIYRKNSKKKNGSKIYHDFVDDAYGEDDGGGGGGGGGDDDGDDDEMVPPHEYIAKKLARSQISSFSMCEGIGRTLKGRDLSKVRNAILTKTGFVE